MEDVTLTDEFEGVSTDKNRFTISWGQQFLKCGRYDLTEKLGGV